MTTTEVSALIDIARRIDEEAAPATASGGTCFVPRYQIEQLRDARKALESALASAEPVAWSRTDDIADDDGCPIGTDEPRVVWGSEHPDPSETWFPLYGEPMLVTHDAQPAAKGESLGDGLRDYPYLIGLAKVLRMRGDPENANALDSVAERIRRTAPTPASVPDGCHVVRYNDDGEFGQKVGWLYRTGGDLCVISGKPVYVWRPIAELLETQA